MTSPTLPTAHEFEVMLTGLLNRQVKASLTTERALPPLSVDQYYGVYDDGKGETAAAWISDLPASAALGSALTLLPKNLAEVAIKEKKFGVDLHDNLREVVNISANSFHGQRVRLIEFVGCVKEAPKKISALMGSKVKWAKFSVVVTGFFTGIVVLVVKDDES